MSSGVLPTPGIFRELYGDDSVIQILTEDIPSDIKGIGDYCYKKLGNPKDNINYAVSGMVNTTRAMGGMGATAVNTECLERMLDTDGMVKLIRSLPSESADLDTE